MGLSFFSAIGVVFFFGTNAATDAYFLARRTIGSLTLLFEGVAEISLVPGLIERNQIKGTQALLAHTTRLETRCYLIALPLCVLLGIFAETTVGLIAPGLAPEAVAQAGLYLTMMVATAPIIIASSISGAMLAALDVFALSTLIRLLPRIGIVIALLLVPFGMPLTGVVIAFMLGSFLMLIAFLSKRREILKTLKDAPPKLSQKDQSVTPMLWSRNAAIVVISLSFLAQTTLESYYASLAEVGALTLLVLSQRISNIGISEVMRSLLSVYYASFARIALGEDRAALHVEMENGMRSSSFYVFPLAACLFALSTPVAFVLMRMGAFEQNTALLAGQLIGLMGLVAALRAPASVLETVLLAAPKLPHIKIVLTVSAVALILRIAYLEFTIGTQGVLAIGYSGLLAAALMMIGYLIWAWRAFGYIMSGALLGRLALLFIAAGGSAALGYAALTAFPQNTSIMVQIAGLGIAGALTTVSYLTLTASLGIPEARTLLGSVSRKLNKRRK